MNRTHSLVPILILSASLVVACATGSGGSGTTVARQVKEVKTLHMEAEQGNIEGIRALLSKGANINEAEPQFGHTPLMRASISNRTEAVDFLLEKGASVNAVDKANMSALTWAVNHQSYESFLKLLKKGARVDTKENLFGKTPLMNAVSLSNAEFSRQLIHRGAAVNAQCKDGNTPLIYAALNQNGNMTEIINLLVRKGARVNKTNNKGMTPLLAAIQGCRTEHAQELIKKGANVNTAIADGSGVTPLMLAAYNGCYDTVVLLANNRANIFAKDARGASAWKYQQVKSVEMLRSALYSGYSNNYEMQKYGQIADFLESRGLRR
jgi:ankyrin repeat protein